MSKVKSTSVVGLIGVVYGFRLEASSEFRYIGLTTASIRRRTQQHYRIAESGHKTPFYDWLRKTPAESIYVASLEVVTTTLEDLGQAEAAWIARLRRRGDRLLNISEGGIGPTGVMWTDEQREAARIRSTGRRVAPRFGPDNPMFGQTHSDEQKARWSEARRGSYSGVDNPNFGKFGSEHPSFGHTMTPESRAALSEQRRGVLNPNFGKVASDETREKMSAVRKGRPMPSSARSAHTRHHTNKGVMRPECEYCIEDAAKKLNGPTTGNDNK